MILYQYLFSSPCLPQVARPDKSCLFYLAAIGRPSGSHSDWACSNLHSCTQRYIQSCEMHRCLPPRTVRKSDRETRRDYRNTRTLGHPCREYFSDRARPACRLLYWGRIYSRVARMRIRPKMPLRLPYLRPPER